ncbi:hypothetical protein CORMATOL_02283 [Corynebacterium matruchotii ATCC 33806]|uniref:Uncharacterized protein n=1 Tax=Corynebacterium matruchotii ATCC 33806 TaxID=566549 RepID=C0E5J3_9CORY|nr:hypothetical protein CORMATOL_02283 [Corynebacterium matruchotii ATCC 33806]
MLGRSATSLGRADLLNAAGYLQFLGAFSLLLLTLRMVEKSSQKRKSRVQRLGSGDYW